MVLPERRKTMNDKDHITPNPKPQTLNPKPHIFSVSEHGEL